MAVPNPNADWAGAVHAWSDALGPDRVCTAGPRLERLQNTVSGLQRRIPARLFPCSTEEVQRVVRIANAHGTALYPVSTGMNWGLGSALPTRDDTAVVDLSGMNRIHEVNVAHHYADIEPGVTQGRLYDYLRERALPLRLNVTGAGRETSLIGNALERGIGYFSTRADALSGLEVVLGNGEIVRTGFSHLDSSQITHLYAPGIGPDLTGLFAQSNFGIVTRAGFALIPDEGKAMSVVAKIAREEQLIPFFNALIDLRRRGIVRTIWHVGNRHRSEIALAPLVVDQLRRAGAREDLPKLREQAVAMMAREKFGAWNAVGGVFGTPRMLRAMRREISSALRGVASVMFLDDRLVALGETVLPRLPPIPIVRQKRIMLDAMKPLYHMAQGIPTDAALKSVGWPVEQDPSADVPDTDPGHNGMLYVLPFFPLSGETARDVVDTATRVFARAGFNAYITLNFINARIAEAVINCAFDRRDPEQTAAAHRCVDELTTTYIDRGYPPYRLGIQHMGLMVDGEKPFWRMVRAVKNTLDPQGVIAPGRYCPDE